MDWVYALDAATGEVQWRDCVPISIERLHYYRDKLCLRSARQIAEYDPSSGKRLRLASVAYGYNGVAFLDDLVVTSGVEGAAVVNLAETGEPHRYQDQPALEEVLVLRGKRIAGWPRLASMATPLVIGDFICFAATSGELSLIRPDVKSLGESVLRQETVWTTKLGGTCHSSPIYAGGRLLVGCDNGLLYAFRVD